MIIANVPSAQSKPVIAHTVFVLYTYMNMIHSYMFIMTVTYLVMLDTLQ